MELAQDKIDLIKKIIKSDRKYVNNEDLFDDFFNESYKRSFLIVKTVENPVSLEAYLKKIVTTSIITVLKDLGRLRRTSSGFVPTKEKSIEHIKPKSDEKSFSDVNITYDIIDLKETPEEKSINKETLQSLVDAITIAHNNEPSKQYMQLYELRYIKGLKQKQIAEELNLSQSEVSKRLLELMNQVRATLGEE